MSICLAIAEGIRKARLFPHFKIGCADMAYFLRD